MVTLRPVHRTATTPLRAMVSFRIDPGIRERLRRHAHNEMVSIVSVIEVALDEYLTRNGQAMPPPLAEAVARSVREQMERARMSERLAIGTSGEPGPGDVPVPDDDPCEAESATLSPGTAEHRGIGLPGAVASRERRIRIEMPDGAAFEKERP